MKIEKIERIACRLPLKHPFVTSYGQLTEKAFDLYLVTAEEGTVGIGELVAFEQPDYIEETLFSARQVIETALIPLLIDQEIEHPQEVWQLFQTVQGNYMAKSALETAIWDLYGKQTHQSVKELYTATRPSVAVGVSIGMQDSVEKLMALVADYVAQGYQRIKLKIKPGQDLAPLRAIRQAFPELLLMADSNGAYQSEPERILALDDLGLVMIEQPLKVRDLVGHSQLQRQMKTPLCLDEDIRTAEDVDTVAALDSCRAINLKIPRVGGITEALRILDRCQTHGLLVWLGGMFESGVGRAMNLQFASQDIFHFPGDLSASDRYFYDDVITQPATLHEGKLLVPDGKGFGITLAETKLSQYGQPIECIYSRK
ncbi:O-succinylbenzoate synthase [Enterococcus sp. DIV1083b]|uniref:o-succinylbenzoate synthase n=1 Tax=Enterococcus sp. DIV1083b TaxID=2774661 RepID=UPI003F205E81